MSGEKEKEELENQQIWNLLDGIKAPAPESNMEMRFQGMLDHYKQEERDKRNHWKDLWSNLRLIFTIRPQAQFAYSLVLIALSLGAGYLLNQKESTKNDENEQLSTLAAQVKEMRKMMIVSLLENPSASERLRAVNYTGEMRRADHQVIAALLTTLNEDQNVNVRLVTLDVLAKFSDQPEVRVGLVSSITRQDSPLVQVAMANLMLKLQEKSAVDSLKALLEQQELNGAVRTKIEHTIDKLII
jgi:hypothetical protein